MAQRVCATALVIRRKEILEWGVKQEPVQKGVERQILPGSNFGTTNESL